MEGNTFVAPGHLPISWNKFGPPGQFPSGHQHQQEASWMTPEIRSELQVRRRLQEESRRTCSSEDHQAYQIQNEKVQHMIHQSKTNLGLKSTYNPTPSVPKDSSSKYRSAEYQHPAHSQTPEYQHPNHLQRMPVTANRSEFYQKAANYYSKANGRKGFSCGPCNRTFYNQKSLDEHMKDHVECPFPECKLSAHIKVIDNHINNQHILINFANLQIDDETWIADRKKRFPTAQRAELRRAEQMEKLKRGEKLGKSTKPFPKGKNKMGKFDKGNMKKTDRQRRHTKDERETQERETKGERGHQEKQTRGEKGPQERKMRGEKGYQKRQMRGERPYVPQRASLEVDLYDSDSEERGGIPAFKGTKNFYESIGELSYFANRKEGFVDSDADEDTNRATDESACDDNDISDDEEWQLEGEEKTTTSSGLLSLGGALGSLMTAYSDSEEESLDIPEPSQTGGKQKDFQDDSTKVSVKDDAKSESINLVNTTSDPLENVGQGENTKKDIKAEIMENSNETTGKHRSRRRPRHHRHNNRRPEAPGGRRVVRRPFPRRRKTLLERLLQNDIIHERNIILQCVHFIVKNNFFEEASSQGNRDKEMKDVCEDQQREKQMGSTANVEKSTENSGSREGGGREGESLNVQRELGNLGQAGEPTEKKGEASSEVDLVNINKEGPVLGIVVEGSVNQEVEGLNKQEEEQNTEKGSDKREKEMEVMIGDLQEGQWVAEKLEGSGKKAELNIIENNKKEVETEETIGDLQEGQRVAEELEESGKKAELNMLSESEIRSNESLVEGNGELLEETIKKVQLVKIQESDDDEEIKGEPHKGQSPPDDHNRTNVEDCINDVNSVGTKRKNVDVFSENISDESDNMVQKKVKKEQSGENCNAENYDHS